jgi:hypothetical protein
MLNRNDSHFPTIFTSLEINSCNHRSSPAMYSCNNCRAIMVENIADCLMLPAICNFSGPSKRTFMVTSVVANLLWMTRNYDKFITFSRQSMKLPTRRRELKQLTYEKFCICIILEACFTLETSNYTQNSTLCHMPSSGHVGCRRNKLFLL